MGADLVTVSTDSEHVHLAWKHDERELANVQYLMGSDRQHRVSALFGVLDETSGRALRGTFIIKPDGTLLNADISYYNLGRNIDELMRRFKASIYMERKGGSEACPSKWKDEGDKTLVNAGAEMVGRVHEALAR
jgi:peroxiredoxin (alkyl hydroperoxide reductase subunit C)